MLVHVLLFLQFSSILKDYTISTIILALILSKHKREKVVPLILLKLVISSPLVENFIFTLGSQMAVHMMIKQVDEDEKALETIFREDGSTHKQWFLTENGLYEVLMQSRKQNTSIFYQKKDTQTLCALIEKKFF